MKINTFPLVKAACCFIMGMLAFPIFSCQDYLFLIFITALYCVIEFMPATWKWHGWVVHLLLYSISFILGNYFYSSNFKAVQLSSLPEVHDSFVAKFEEQPLLKSFHIEAKLSIARKSTSPISQEKKFTRVLAKFSLADTAILHFQKGDNFTFEGCPRQIPFQKNPQRFQRKIHLFYQGFVQEIRIGIGCWVKRNSSTNYSFSENLEKIRRNFSKELDKKFNEPREAAIIKALLLGVRDGMPADVLQTFSKTGAIHVLSVSGLHVGAVLFIFIWIIERMTRRYKRYKGLPVIILIPLAFSYMFITGLSSSVIRSVIMISTVIIGKTWFKNTNSINLLFVCAIWMLLYNPFYIHDLSFQFSFLSLGGILILQPELKKWWSPQSYIYGYVWELTTVSVAAQLFVFPLSIYYFHQFPIYFIPAGLLAIPLSILLVYGGLLIPLIMYTNDSIQNFFFSFYSTMVRFLDASMQFIEDWPFSVWKQIYFDFWDVLGLYLVLACLINFFCNKSMKTFYIAALLMLVLMGKFIIRDVGQNSQMKFSFYALQRGYLVDIYYGKMAFVIKSKNLDSLTEKYNADYNRVKHGILNVINIDDGISVNAEDFEFNQNVCKIGNLYWAKNFNAYEKMKDSLTFSMIFISKEDKYVPKFDISIPATGLVILSSDISKKMKRDWMNYLQGNKIPFVDITSKGYFEWNITRIR